MLDLKPFCADISTKYACANPFSRGGKMYATDGRILVGVPTSEPDSNGEFISPDDIAHVMFPIEHWKPWPRDENIVRGNGECPDCNGYGGKKCEQCGGFGAGECPTCHQDIDCAECFGNGYTITCRTCKGKKRLDDIPIRQLVCRRWIAWKYAKLVRSLPSVEFGIDDRDEHSPLRFRFDGGEGAVMPLMI